MVRLGQHFPAEANLLAGVVRNAELEGDEVVLEVGGGEGALSRALAPRARALHVIELDGRLREPLGAVAAEHPNVSIHFGDAMRLDLGGLDPAPTAVVSNLPYSIATPLILRTIAELPALERWTLMVQREIADRLRASSGTRAYGAPSKLNLCLFLGPRRKDGRHELVSVFCPLSLADWIVVEPAEADEVVSPRVDGPNLAGAALAALRARGWSQPPVRIGIEKRIPV